MRVWKVAKMQSTGILPTFADLQWPTARKDAGNSVPIVLAV